MRNEVKFHCLFIVSRARFNSYSSAEADIVRVCLNGGDTNY